MVTRRSSVSGLRNVVNSVGERCSISVETTALQAAIYGSVSLPIRHGKHALVALGANLPFGDLSPERTISAAISALEARGLSPRKVSRLFRTPCFPAGAGPDYVNAAAVMTLRHEMTAEDVLRALHAVEAEFGRERMRRWAGRTLDLDLLAMDDSILPDPDVHSRWVGLAPADQARMAPDRLILPHPRLQDRAFVLIPLRDVAPDWVHPLTGKSVTEMADALPAAEIAEVVPL